MKKNILNKLAIISCLLVMVSCAAKKKMVIASNTVTTDTPATAKPVKFSPPVVKGGVDPKLISINGQQLNFNTFSAKAKANLTVDGTGNDVDINIRINRDREIWVSITKTLLITVEVARAVITPDSIKIVNRLEGTYLRKPFSYVYAYSNDQVNYKMLESIFTGNALPEVLNDANAGFLAEGTTTIISGSLQDLVYKLIVGSDMKPTQLNLSNHNQGQALHVNNSNFININGHTVPSQIDIQSASQKNKIQCNLHYTRVDLDQPLQYTFSIPDGYKPMDN